MCDTADNSPYICFKGEHLNLIQINLQSESSTGDSVQSACENSEVKRGKTKKKVGKKNTKKLHNTGKYENCLRKKTKRGKTKAKVGEAKNNKNKIILNIFNEFKNNSPYYKEFSQFHAIEKNIKNDVYSSSADLANDMRNLFSSIFLVFYNDSEKYNKTLILCELFEKIYKKYDNQILTKECKNLLETINKLKKELRQTELSKNASSENLFQNFASISNTKLKFTLGGGDQDNELSVKNYKNQIMSKIQKLTTEQKKGLYNVISNACIDTNTQDNVMEINVNKMTRNQLKQLEKYINQCIKENNCGINFPSTKSLELKRFFEEEKELDILKNDDLSSCLSDDDDEDDE
jgi:hypothetical protein